MSLGSTFPASSPFTGIFIFPWLKDGGILESVAAIRAFLPIAVILSPPRVIQISHIALTAMAFSAGLVCWIRNLNAKGAAANRTKRSATHVDFLLALVFAAGVL